MANIAEIAAAAGVSTATVSRAINTPEKVRPETLRRIQETIQQFNYAPANNRRIRSDHTTRTILVVMDDFSNIFLIDVLSGINKSALKNGYSLLLFATNSLQDRERETIKLLNNHQADGVILLSSHLDDDDLKQIYASHPMVQCCEYSDTCDLPHVSIDNKAAYMEAIEFLIKLGYTDIALLSSNNGLISTTLREAAYFESMRKFHLSPSPKWFRRNSDSFYGGYESMQAILRQGNLPRAVLCNTDTSAAGAIRAIHEAGLRVPQDIAVMGTDNLEICNMITPTLTTTAQPRKRIGQVAVEMLIRQIIGEKDQESLFLPHELIVRNST